MSFFNNRGNNSGSGETIIIQRDEVSEEFTATANQTIFTSIPNKGKLLRVVVGGVEQFSPKSYTSTGAGSFTLVAGVPVGTFVVGVYQQ